MTEVSVILPTYNRADLVGDAIKSVLDQSFRDFELVVVDDGSTDNTESVVRSYNDKRIKYIWQPNQGASAARNAGLRECKGDLIAFLDSDDLFLPGKIEKQLAKLDQNPNNGLIYSQYLIKRDKDRPFVTRGRCDKNLGLHRLLLGTGFHWSTVLIRREWLEKAGNFDENIPVGEEWDLTLRLSLSGCPISCVPEPLVIVRQLPDSLGKAAYRYQDKVLLLPLDKAFANPRMPKEMQALKDKTYAARYVRMAASAFIAAKPEQGRELLLQTYNLESSLDEEDCKLLITILVSRIIGLSMDNPEEVIRLVTSCLPGDKQTVNKLSHKIWGEYYLDEAFSAYENGRYPETVKAGISAILNAPENLLNRGLLVIIGSSISNGVTKMIYSQSA